MRNIIKSPQAIYCQNPVIYEVEVSWNVKVHAQKPDFVFRRNGRDHLNRRGRQFSWLLAAELCASAVVMLDTPCSDVVLRVLATHSIRQFPLHFSSRTSPCVITFHVRERTVCPDDNLSFRTLLSSFSKVQWWYSEYLKIGAIHSLVFSLEGWAWQEPEHSHMTGMAMAHCILGKFLGVVCHCLPPPLDVPTLATRCLRTQRRERS